MRRWTRLILIALALGAVVNVLVAWAVLWLPAGNREFKPTRVWDTPQPWTIPMPPEAAALLGESEARAFGRCWRRQHPVQAYSNLAVTHADSGFPFRSMTTVRWPHAVATTEGTPHIAVIGFGDQQSIFYRGVEAPSFMTALLGDPSARLPLRPRPLAFLGNALIYTVVLLTLHAVWYEGRERWRTRRGRCAACGYDIAGVERCPECGETCTPHAPTA